MKKIIISIILILTLTGCWNYKELNDYSIVTGIAIDKVDENKYEVSTLISNSPKNNSQNGSNESQIVIYSGKGNSIVNALKEIGLISPKELYLGSFSILVISEDIAKDGINNVIDFFFRYSNSRKNFDIVIAKDAKAKDAIKIMSPLTNFPSQNISENLDSTTKLQGIISKTNFNTLLATLLRDGISPTINSINIVGNSKEGEKKKNLETSSPDNYVKLGNLGIFKDDKLISWTTHNESLGINIINNKISEMYLKVKYKDGYVVIDTSSFKSNTSVCLKNNKPYVNIKLNGTARIIEVKGNIDLSSINVIQDLEKKSNKNIKKYANEAIELAKKYETDIFGFGLKFYQKYPKYFNKNKKNWDKNLDKLNINITSNIILENKVSAKNSLEGKNGKE
ncbi:MAG: Ger(x)C family spore germination protein [bacterium]|nr:Ger(x)C family spore germination protein [bacterium]